MDGMEGCLGVVVVVVVEGFFLWLGSWNNITRERHPFPRISKRAPW